VLAHSVGLPRVSMMLFTVMSFQLKVGFSSPVNMHRLPTLGYKESLSLRTA
jgi:hypothetical protein